MEQPLAALESALAAASRSSVLESLRPGATADDVQQVFTDLRLGTPPGNLVALYAWRNGQNAHGHTLGQIWLIPPFVFLAIEEAAALYESSLASANELAATEGVDAGVFWNPTWWPVLNDVGTMSYVVDLSESDGTDAPVLGVMFGDDDRPRMHSSVRTMIDVLAATHGNGALFNDPEGYLDQDDEAFMETLHRIDSAAEFWRDD